MLEKLCGICRFHLPHFEMLVDNLHFSEKAQFVMIYIIVKKLVALT